MLVTYAIWENPVWRFRMSRGPGRRSTCQRLAVHVKGERFMSKVSGSCLKLRDVPARS